ncbi:hypothetical protein M0804_006696 [Polistes exclamans]|nr:hypothetical protein M0804_006696 [Polistes exclamans]
MEVKSQKVTSYISFNRRKENLFFQVPGDCRGRDGGGTMVWCGVVMSSSNDDNDGDRVLLVVVDNGSVSGSDSGSG